jgi:hypothetical protein
MPKSYTTIKIALELRHDILYADLSYMSSYRIMVETTGSMIKRLWPKHIHAVASQGFELKVALFEFACTINYL